MSINHTNATAAEQSEQQPANGPPPSRLSVIGIGASAGGLAALRAFFAALPERSGLTFVVVVHLSPEHESMLAALLQPYTTMPVMQVTARTEMKPNQVYVIPPGKHLVVTDNFLELTDLDQTRQRQPQIDAFFRSLTESHGDGGAVILSGSGSDGAVGIQAIKEKGGLILVQAPEEAEYDGMPRSAIATGLVDIVAPAAQLATQLVAAKQTHLSFQLPVDGEQLSTAAQNTLTQLLAQLRLRTGHDFSGYKPATILRRISRRMQLTQTSTLTAYLQRLRQNTHEAEALFRDLLINVTEFFRDPEAWAALESTIIPQLFAGKGRDDRVRVWSVGCATGEEAYSIAMLLLEYADELVAPPAIQIFASDLGKTALDFAREGCYPAAIADSIPAPRLARFFSKENSHYRARPELSEAILFTQHNLLQAPPFSRLDLILCRNLLIYIQRDLQEKVFETFYYALRPEGYLFLGNAESAEGITDLFETLDKRRRLYQRRPQHKAAPILPSLPLLPQPVHVPAPGAESPRPAPVRPSEEHHLLLETVAPPSVLVDRDYNVLHLSETAGRYLLPPGGAPTVEVLKLVRPELQSELRAALLHAFEENRAVATRPIPVRFNGAAHPVYLMVRPHQLVDGQMRALVIFLEDETPLADTLVEGNLSQSERRHLEAELRNVQSRLQSMREEYETTVEELRAANEELQSTNEEYKSTLEELETSKEELQSVNEELQTINQELKNKIDEVTHAHNDVQNLFIATDIATLFLDRELRVKRYTPRAADLFNLMPTDRGRPITHLRTTLRYEQLEGDAQRVLAHLTPVEREVQSQDERWFLVCSRPYRTQEDKIDGVVITFIDITANKANELALRNAKEYAESIVHTIPDALLVLDPDLRVQMANDAFYEIFQVQHAATEGRLIYELGNGQWNIPALRTLLEEILPENKVFLGYEVEHTFEQIGQRTMLVNGRRLDHVQLILLAITDITERKRAEEALRASEEKYRTLFESIDEGFCIIERVAGEPLDFRYVEANPAFAVQSGVEDVIGKTIRQVVPDEPEEWFAIYDRVLQTGAAIRFERELVSAGRVLELYAFPVADQADSRLAVIFKDITERKVREQQQEFLLNFSDTLRAEPNADAVANRALQMLSAQMGLDRCYIGVYRLAEDRADFTHQVGNERVPPLPAGVRLSDFPGALRVAFDRTLVIEDVAETEGLSDTDRRNIAALGLRALVAASLRKGENNPLWSIVAVSASPRRWTWGEIALIEEATERTWTAVERAKAEEALRQSAERYRLLFTNMSEGFALAEMIWDEYSNPVDWRYLEVNQAWEQTGVPVSQTTGRTAREVNPHIEPGWIETYGRVVQTGEPFRYETYAVRFGKWFETFAYKHSENCFGLLFRDVTDRRRAEEALRESEEKYRTLFDSIDEGFAIEELVYDSNGEIEDIIFREVNQAYERQGGLTGVVGKSIKEVLPHLEQHWKDAFAQVAKTGEPLRTVNYAQDVDRWFDVYMTMLSGSDKYVAVVFDDITERKRNELNLAFLAEVSTEFAALTSADAVINYIGEKLAHHFGLSRCDFSVVEEEADRITTIYDWRHAADAPSVLGEHAISTFLTPLARQQYIAGELAVINDVHHDPRINAPPAIMDALHIRSVVDAPYLENGRWKFLLSACRAEVSVWRADEIELIRELAARIYIRLQRAYAEEHLRESEGRLRVMIENLPGGAVFIVDRNLCYLLAEGEALSTAGFVSGDLVGKSLFDALSPDVVMAYEPKYRQALAGTPFLHEHESHGRAYISRGTPLRGADGEVYGVLVVSYDITERKQAEMALQHLNATLEQQVDTRTVQVRVLASELTMAEQEERRRVSQILHDDLQQLLYGMQMRMMAMMNDLKSGNSDSLMGYAQEVYNWMSDAIQTTRRLTVDLSPPLLKGEGLADALRWLIPQMATVNDLQATLEVVEPCEIPNQGMRVLLFQIVRELLFNVVKHAGVNTATVVLQQEGGACVIKVSDTGRGFDPVAVAAKGEKGFGLFSINERLKLFGGRMTIQSAPGQGTAITVYAPVGTVAQKPA